MGCLLRLLVIVLPLVVSPKTASADIVTSGGVLTYERTPSEGFLRRYSFDGQLTDELEVNLNSLPIGGILAMTVVGSRVIVAENPFSGRRIGEINTSTGNVSYLFDHQGFIGSKVPLLDTIGNELLIHTFGPGTGATQAYGLNGNISRGFSISDEQQSYRQADGMAYANGEIYYTKNNQPPSNLIGVFNSLGSPEMPLLREIPLNRTGIGDISVNAGNGEIWTVTANTGFLIRYDASGNQLDTFSTVDGIRDFYVLSTSAVPEPNSFVLLGLAIVCLSYKHRRAKVIRTVRRDRTMKCTRVLEHPLGSGGLSARTG